MYPARRSLGRGGKDCFAIAGLAALLALSPWGNGASKAFATGVGRPSAASPTNSPLHRSDGPGSGPLALACRPYRCVVDSWIVGPLTSPASVGHGIAPLSQVAIVDSARTSGGTTVSETIRVTNRAHATSLAEGETIVGPVQEQWNVELQTPVHTFSVSMSAATGLYSPPMTVAFSAVPVLPQTRYILDSIRYWSHTGRAIINGRKSKIEANSAEHFIYFFHLARPAAPR